MYSAPGHPQGLSCALLASHWPASFGSQSNSVTWLWRRRDASESPLDRVRWSDRSCPIINKHLFAVNKPTLALVEITLSDQKQKPASFVLTSRDEVVRLMASQPNINTRDINVFSLRWERMRHCIKTFTTFLRMSWLEFPFNHASRSWVGICEQFVSFFPLYYMHISFNMIAFNENAND